MIAVVYLVMIFVLLALVLVAMGIGERPLSRLACRLGFHLPENGRVGPCLRGCGHVTQTWSNGRIWERHVRRPRRED